MQKNVLIFGHSYSHGFLEATRQYIKLFDTKKYKTTVVYLNGESNEEIKKQHLQADVIFINALNQDKRGLKLKPIKQMLNLHKKNNFEIVICHRYKPSYIMICVSLFHKIPLLFSIMHEMGTIQNLSRKLFLRLFANKNMYFAGVSNAVRDDIYQNSLKISKEKIITLYNTIDLEETEPQFLTKNNARDKLNIKEDVFLFGILGRLVAAKDHKTLIDAFSKAKINCKAAKLLIIGDGELKEELQSQVIRLNLEKDVIITGFLPDAFTLLKALDIFVLSSIQEAFGRVLIEAMAAKLPIIATKTNGIPEVLGDTGTLVEKQNSLQMSEAMCYYYNLKKDQVINEGTKSYKRAVETFSMQKFKENFWRLQVFKN